MDFHLPKNSVEKNEILKKMQDYRSHDVDWKNGKIFSMVYYLNDEYYDFIKKAHNLYFSENGLNPMAFRSLKEFEREVVRMTINLHHGDDNCVGVMTTGGTESILMAVKTYRDRARKLKPWIRNPEMIVPDTIHVAFDKAGKYFDVKIKKIPVGDDFKVDVKKLKKAITRNTIMIAASAPQYPHGVIDDIEAIGEIAQNHKIPFHVDACVGGFILPFLEKLGEPITPFDYRVKGVTSISSDLHKYGYAPKGASTITYRSMDYMKFQFFVYESWPGGIYASPSFPGTKSGGAIAGAWAAMMALGEEGYLKEAQRVIDTRNKFIQGIQKIPELKILGEANTCIVTYTTKNPEHNIYLIADFLNDLGWNVDRQQKPESIHHTISPHHDHVMDQFLIDLKAAVEFVKNNPKIEAKSNAAMYGMMAKIPFRGMVKKAVEDVMMKMYSAKGIMPDENKNEPESILDVVQKVGLEAMEVKRQLDKVITSVKSNFRK
jgi:sphinganine-1-phosphate aldolase